jgi:leucyl/phenylalanyl-tRNA--protein transferase
MHAPVESPDVIPAELLLLAYRNGIFPMADARDDEDVFWVEPRERAIIPLDAFHLSKSLRKTLGRDRYSISCNRAFDEVIAACAAPREPQAESWISGRIEASYLALHQAGHAHSFECWSGKPGDGVLVGGLYGVSFDSVFCGESMFSRADNASKIALCALIAAMRLAGYALLDCQFMTDHLASLGAVAIPQEVYLENVQAANREPAASLETVWQELAQAPSPGKLIAQSLTQTS